MAAHLYQCPQLRLADFKSFFNYERLVQRIIATRPGNKAKAIAALSSADITLTTDETTYHCRPVVSDDGIVKAIAITWKHRRKEFSTKVSIERAANNLDLGCVRYLLCPRTWKRCRVLYIIEPYLCDGLPHSIITSRHTFRSVVYASQTRGKNECPPDPYRKYGKTMYKGKQTAYGRKIEKFEERERQRFARIFGWC